MVHPLYLKVFLLTAVLSLQSLIVLVETASASEPILSEEILKADVSSVYKKSPSLESGYASKIIGGTFVEPNTYPWFTRLYYKSGSYYYWSGCGGMLVSPEFVLTAAHCMSSTFKSNPYVFIGALDTNDSNNGGQYGELIQVEAVIQDADYSSSTTDHDFALLRLATPSTITPAEMDSSRRSDSYQNGKGLWTIGKALLFH